MVANRKVTGRTLSVPAGIGLGAAACVVLTLAGAALLAWLSGRETISDSGLGIGCGLVLLISSSTGGILAAALIRKQRLMVCTITAASYYGILLGMTALLFGGQYQGMGVTLVCVLAGAALAAMPVFLGVRSKGAAGKRRVFR